MPNLKQFDTLINDYKAPLKALFPMWLYDESYVDERG